MVSAIVVAGDQNDGQGFGLDDFFGRLDTVDIGQTHGHQDNVRIFRMGEDDGALARRPLADNFVFGFPQNRTQAHARGLVVVDDQYPSHVCACRAARPRVFLRLMRRMNSERNLSP